MKHWIVVTNGVEVARFLGSEMNVVSLATHAFQLGATSIFIKMHKKMPVELTSLYDFHNYLKRWDAE